MKVAELYRQKSFVFSIEIYPPKTQESLERLKVKLKEFRSYHPDFISVTYGAGGSTRENTHELASYIQNDLGIEAMAHLTCVSHTRLEIETLLEQFHQSGIENLMALRGDPPSGKNHFQRPSRGFAYAVELIESIRALNGFCIGAAGYPEGHVENPDREADLRHQKAKVDAGAELLVSQFFLVNEFFLKWRDRLHRGGVRVPIIPGLLLPSSAEALFRMSKLCGVSIPGSLRAKLERFADDPGALKEIGWNHLEAQTESLLREGIEGVHLYALNRLETVRRFSQLIQPVSGRHDTYSENPEKCSIAENSKIPMTV